MRHFNVAFAAASRSRPDINLAGIPLVVLLTARNHRLLRRIATHVSAITAADIVLDQLRQQANMRRRLHQVVVERRHAFISSRRSRIAPDRRGNRVARGKIQCLIPVDIGRGYFFARCQGAVTVQVSHIGVTGCCKKRR